MTLKPALGLGLALAMVCTTVEPADDAAFWGEQDADQVKLAAAAPTRLRGSAPCGFRAFFERNNAGPGIHKWLHYFSAYEQEFSRHCGDGAAPAKMIEIGIQLCGNQIYGAFEPARWCGGVPHRSTEPALPRCRREMT